MDGGVEANVEREKRQTVITDFFKPVEKEGTILDNDEAEVWEAEEGEEEEEEEEEDYNDECSCSSCSPSDDWSADDEIIGGQESYEDNWAECERQRWLPARQWSLIDIFDWDRARKVDPAAFSTMYYQRAFGYGFARAQRAEKHAAA